MKNSVIPVSARITPVFFQKFLLMVTTVIKYEINPPIMGAKKMKKITVKISFPVMTPKPSSKEPLAIATWVTAAPAKPPIKVCEDEEGIPNHHVRRFQMVAAISPEKITQRSMALLSTVFATVFPTLISNTQKARTLKKYPDAEPYIGTFVDLVRERFDESLDDGIVTTFDEACTQAVARQQAKIANTST